MKWPIDTSAFSFMGSLPPEPVLDRETKQPKTDVNSEPLFSMDLMCFWEKGAEVLTVKFPGTPAVGLRQGTSDQSTVDSLGVAIGPRHRALCCFAPRSCGAPKPWPYTANPASCGTGSTQAAKHRLENCLGPGSGAASVG